MSRFEIQYQVNGNEIRHREGLIFAPSYQDAVDLFKRETNNKFEVVGVIYRGDAIRYDGNWR